MQEFRNVLRQTCAATLLFLSLVLRAAPGKLRLFELSPKSFKFKAIQKTGKGLVFGKLFYNALLNSFFDQDF